MALNLLITLQIFRNHNRFYYAVSKVSIINRNACLNVASRVDILPPKKLHHLSSPFHGTRLTHLLIFRLFVTGRQFRHLIDNFARDPSNLVCLKVSLRAKCDINVFCM